MGTFDEIKKSGGGGGAKATDLTPPPPIKLEEAENQAPEGQGAVVAVLKIPAGKNKNIYSPGKEFRVPLFFAYKKSALNDNAKPEALDTKEEYEDVKKALEENPYYKTYVEDWKAGSKTGPANPATVSLEYRDANGDKKEASINAFANLTEALKDPKTGGSSGDIWEKNLTKRLDNLKEMNAKLDALIEELLAAIQTGSTDMIARVIRLFKQKASIESAQLASWMGETLRKVGKIDEETNEEIANLVAKGKDFTAQDQAAVQDLRNKLSLNAEFKNSLMEMVRDSYSRTDELGRLSNSITEKTENINAASSSWR